MNGTSTNDLAALKRELLFLKLNKRPAADGRGEYKVLPKADRGAALPLSWAQQRLWFLDQLDHAAGAAYHMPAALRLQGNLDKAALQAALDRIVARHEALRTTFVRVDGEPVQVIAPPTAGFALHQHDLSMLAESEQAAAVARMATDEVSQPFDLASGPLIRGQLLCLGAHEHVLLITQHHIISDGWSIGVLVREVSSLYAAFSQGQPDPLPPLAIQYADYSAWQRAWLQGETLQAQRDFWLEQLGGAPALLELPTDRPRPPVQSYAGAAVPVVIGAAETAALRALSQRHGCTVFMTLLAAWSVLMARLSGQDDIVTGTPVANRQRRELEPLIGLFVNTLALRVKLEGDPSVAQLLAQVRAGTLGAYSHADLPFEQVVEVVKPPRSLAHSPVFQAMLSLNNTPDHGPLRLPGLTLDAVEQAQATTQFDLTLSLSEGEAVIAGNLDYASDLFDAVTVERIVAGFQVLLASMAEADAAHPVSRLALLPASALHQVLETFNDTARDYPAPALVHQLFEAQARARPDAIAVQAGASHLSYGELNRRANQLAHYLTGQGIGRDARVALCVERGIDMLVGVLGILKAGAAYVPLDPAFPAERLAYMLEDSAPAALVTQRALAELGAALAAPVLVLDAAADMALLAAQSETDPDASTLGLAEAQLAYVIYTSGSTGKPKGVMIEHRSVVNFLHSMSEAPGMGRDDVLLAVTTLSFDIAGLELYLPLMHGARVILAARGETMDPVFLAQAIEREAVTVMQATPATWQLLLDSGWKGSSRLRALCGGEALTAALAARLLGCTESVWNLYGPTETTIWSACRQVRQDDRHAGGVVSIGRPIANTQIYILDGQHQPVPIGVTGELYIGGAGLARGYLNRPELSAERFVDNPFAPGARLYRTGDLGRWRADGTIDYVGRNDFQVKLRGFRIELGEIETKLRACAGVRDSVVALREDGNGDKRLVAYLIPTQEGSVSVKVLREQLSGTLADYMIPSAFVELAQFPLTPNGKLDRAALPAPDMAAVAQRDYAAPEGELEAAIAAIWQGLLGLPRVSRWDNFFELGGHSLLAVQLRARLEQTLQVDVSLRQIFAQANLADLAALVDDAKPALHKHIAPADRSVALPLSWAQQRLWFLDQLDHAAGAAYHMPAALRLQGNLDKAALQAALDRIVARHEALRTTFVRVDGEPVQVIAPPTAGFALHQHDLSMLAGSEQAAAVARMATDEVSQPFDLASGPLIRGQLLCLGAHEHVLLITQHHIISDGWSIGVLVREVSSLYAAFSQGQPDPLPPLAIQYADYSAWQRAWLQGETLQAQRDFWLEQLGGAPALLELPTDRPRPPVQSYAGALHAFALSQDTSAALRAVCQRHGTTLFMVMLAGWSVLMARLSGQDDVVIGTPVANRNHVELEPLIGFFANTLALRVRHTADLRVDQLLADVKALTLDAYAHQDLPFEQVVDVVKPTRSLAHSPLFQSMIRLDNASSAPQLQLPSLTVASLLTLHMTTRFDLTLVLAEDGDAIAGNIEYASDLFDPATIGRLGRQFSTLMEGIAADTSQYVGMLPLLDEEERALVLHRFNETTVSYPQDKFVHQLFEEQVTRTPDAPALVFEDDTLTYDVLNQRANVVAHTLLSMGVQPDSIVAICIERSVEMVVGLLGILKAGAAYVPLDPSYPEQRLSYMLDDSAPVAVLTSTTLHSSLPLLAACRASVLRLDAMVSSPSADWLSNPDPRVLGLAPHHLAYVIYTSGSTGMPKGAMNQHSGAVNRLLWAQDEYALDASDRVLQKTPFSFDVSVWEFFLPLLAGSTLVMARPNGHQDPHYLADLMANAGITMLHFVPSMLQVFLDRADTATCTSVRHLLCSGEALPYALQVRCQQQLPHAQLHNLYGPTEAAIDVTSWRCDDQHPGIVPIGRPIANTQIYILDTHMQPVPIGIAGELHIGGVGVGRGYLNRPELSAKRFIADPFGKAGDRLYKTGDLGRWLADGNIDYLGRNDFQVKLRGLRIELGEIEARLREHPGVNDTVVVARPDSSDQQRLVAYLAPSAQALPVTRWLQLQAKDVDAAARNIVLPNGMRVFHQNPTETTFLYDEIFGDEVYLKHGIALGDDACVFDVGANIGLFSLFVAKRCRAARVYAFEPIPPVFASLERNTALYGLGGRVYACGLAAQPGVEDFDFYPHNTVISSSRTSTAEAREVVRAFIENQQERSGTEADAAVLDAVLDERLGTKRYRCQLRTVSEIIAENAIERIDLLKVDVENAELGVLQGIAPGDWPKIAQLVVEVHDVDARLSHITAMLEAQGFTVISQQEQFLRTTAIFNLYAVRAERPAPPPASGWAWEWCSERELIASVRENLSKDLPDYMLPSAFVVLDAFPLSPNGKLDRNALPAPGQDAVASRAYQAPQGDVERALAAIWQALLGLEQVGRHDNFFELGGHSLMAIGLIEKLRQHGLSTEVRTVFEAPTLLEMAARLEAAQAERAFVVPPNLIATDCVAITPAMLPLVTLTQDEIDRVAATVPGGAANIQDIYPLAPLQEGILFHHLLEGEGDAYLLRSMLRFDTRQRLDTFLTALQTVVARHDILRSAICWHGLSQPVQVVYRNATLPVQEVTLSGDDPLLQLQRQSDPRHLRLDLQRAPLLKAFIGADPSSDAWFLSLLNHHIVCDHITLELILAEIEAELLGQGNTLAPSLPYRNFIAQTRAVPQQDHEAYFRAQLGDIDEPTAPFGTLDVLADTQPFAESRLELDAALAADVRRRSRAAGVTPSVLFHLAWAMVVAECSARDDVVFGTVVSGRLAAAEGIERALGMFINTLPMRVTLGARSVHAVVQTVHQAITGLLAHEQCPLSLAQRYSGVASGMPLFTALFNYRHSKSALALGDSGEKPAWDGMTLLASEERTNYPVAMSVDDAGTAFVFTAQSCCMDPVRINAYLQRALEVLVNALDHEPHRLMSTLTVLPPAELEQLVSGFNANAVDYPSGQLVHGLFESQAATQTDAVAVVAEEGTLTYAALNRRANQLAHYLVAQGVQPDMRIGICVERGLDMVVGLLGILKAGGAYVPLDPALPADRIAYMVRDSECALVLTHSHLQPALESAPAPVFFFDESEQLLAQQDVHDPQAHVLGLHAGHLAYVIYTSGSTGMPKGVMNQHDGVVNRLLWAKDAYAIGQDDRILQKTPFSFDVSVWEFFLPLLAGAQLLMARPGGHKDPDYLARVIEEQAITTLHFVPSMLQLFLEHATLRTACPHLRQVLCSGEALPYSLQLSFHRHLPAVQLHNLYGPTEAAIDVTAWHCMPGTHVGIVPIGRPIANTQIYILDAHMRPAPLGVSGELYVGGVGVARGYINRPELTAGRFIASPFVPGTKLYKTGDLGRWLDDGSVEYLGRNDFQVKIRGMRVELGEIEHALLACPGVSHAAVIAQRDHAGEQRLLAYLLPQKQSEIAVESLRAQLSARLAEYMVPTAFIVLDAFPVTANGKLDRRALPMPDLAARQSPQYEAPSNAVETALANLWEQLLGMPRVGRHDHFFELGGHSFLAVQLLSKLRTELGVEVGLRELFLAPTLHRFAEVVGQRRDSQRYSNLVPIRPEGSGTPLFLVHPGGLGSLRYARDIALHLDPDVPVHGLAPRGLVDGEEVLQTVEDMAENYLCAVRHIQPHGPYRLAGWSAGGTIAYEMASQLVGADERVEFLGLIDTHSAYQRAPAEAKTEVLNAEGHGQFDGIAAVLAWLPADLPAARRAQVERHAAERDLDAMLACCQQDGLLPADVEPDILRGHVVVALALDSAVRRYCIHRIPVPLTVFAATQDEAPSCVPGWERLAGKNVRIIPIAANHMTITEGAHLKVLVREMSTVIQQAKQANPNNPEHEYEPCVTIQHGRKDVTPLFCMPGAGASVTAFFELSQALDPNIPVYGLQPRGLCGEMTPYVNVESAANAYVRAIRKIQKSGPYHLLGHSYGGWIAIEMARQLVQAGETIGSLTVLDTEAPSDGNTARVRYSRSAMLMKLVELFELNLPVPMGICMEDFAKRNPEQQLVFLLERVIDAGIFPPTTQLKSLRGLVRVFESNINTHYQPAGMYEGRLTLVSVPDVKVTALNVAYDPAPLIAAWRLHAREVLHREAAGNHLSLLMQPDVSSLAQTIRDIALVETKIPSNVGSRLQSTSMP